MPLVPHECRMNILTMRDYPIRSIPNRRAAIQRLTVTLKCKFSRSRSCRCALRSGFGRLKQMTTCYVDESGTDTNLPEVVVAGLVLDNPGSFWLGVEWAKILNRHGVTGPIHMREFTPHGEFKHLVRNARRALFTDLVRADNQRGLFQLVIRGGELVRLLCLLSETMNAFKELCRAYDEDNASRSAWATRNLLELWIWSAYCSPSEQNARVLVQDTIRDSIGIMNAGQELVSMSPDRGALAPEINKARSSIEGLAKKAGLSKADHKYKKVSDVASELGPEGFKNLQTFEYYIL
jgi:hypothetical protein